MNTATTLTRKDIKRLVADILDGNEDEITKREFLNAIRIMDMERITWFTTFGDNARQRIMNVNEFRHAEQFGYTTPTFSEHGWITTEWTHHETVEFRTTNKMDKHFTQTYLKLAHGPNGNWTFGYTVHTGMGAGTSTPASVFGEVFPTREAALSTGVVTITGMLMKAIESAIERPDPTNMNIPYMRQVIDVIDEYIKAQIVAQSQLSLF